MERGILTERSVGLDLALECARAALAAGQARGYRIAVAIADRAGHLTLLLRSDGAGPHLIDSARRKAYTAASARTRTSVMSSAIDEPRAEPDPHLVYLEGRRMAAAAAPTLPAPSPS